MCLALRVAIVDDEQSCRDQLKDYIGRFSKQWQVEFEVTSFSSGTDIVEHYRPGWDIILLDIRMAVRMGNARSLMIAEIRKKESRRHVVQK